MSVQRDEAWVKSANPEAIVKAQSAGELATYLGGKTAEEQAHDRVVAGTPDRVLAAAYGVSSLQGNGERSSNWFEAKRNALDLAKLEKLQWVESSSPADVYAAEQAGDLDHLLGREVSPEAARLDAIRSTVTAAVTGNRVVDLLGQAK